MTLFLGMHQPKTLYSLSSRICRVVGLYVLLCAGAVAAAAQDPLTLRQAIDQALGQSPEATVARADNQEAKAAASLVRLNCCRISASPKISHAETPVYAFGTRLRQRQFTQDDFALNALNRPQPIGNFATRFSGSWTAFDSFKTQREIRRADLSRESESSSAKAVEQQIELNVVRAYQSVLYAEREIDVAQHEQETAAALLTSAEQHVEAGLAVESDRMSAEVNVASRKQELIAAQGDLDLAWAELSEAMGPPDLRVSALKPIERRPFPELLLEQELEQYVV